ncbi:stress-associated endoplasmic reticulum protein 2 isoform X3 [Rhinopithecus roxellana]|uniref:stress-associated endoplasmic reticulum protein 2 isoform X3 n=1 Tax=Rhinopithecus roxellana TaxID=61622 RepID=UPI0012371992|nr:stress-associated endoplasmic reticulum protein 2 isoform X3 [Rhinopithecus roxellana]
MRLFSHMIKRQVFPTEGEGTPTCRPQSVKSSLSFNLNIRKKKCQPHKLAFPADCQNFLKTVTSRGSHRHPEPASGMFKELAGPGRKTEAIHLLWSSSSGSERHSLEKTSHQPSAPLSYLSDHSEHKDGHVRRPGLFDTTSLPLERGGPRKRSAGFCGKQAGHAE